ncbi:unnamed protein product [Gordionus sp. m RMFG-2023]
MKLLKIKFRSLKICCGFKCVPDDRTLSPKITKQKWKKLKKNPTSPTITYVQKLLVKEGRAKSPNESFKKFDKAGRTVSFGTFANTYSKMHVFLKGTKTKDPLELIDKNAIKQLKRLNKKKSEIWAKSEQLRMQIKALEEEEKRLGCVKKLLKRFCPLKTTQRGDIKITLVHKPKTLEISENVRATDDKGYSKATMERIKFDESIISNISTISPFAQISDSLNNLYIASPQLQDILTSSPSGKIIFKNDGKRKKSLPPIILTDTNILNISKANENVMPSSE